MARRVTPDQTTHEPGPRPDPSGARMDEPLPTANDPGGADSKGYSADPRPEPAVQNQDPIPLAPAPDTQPAIRQPEREGKVLPTGRAEEKDYSPNDRLMGSDR